MNYQLKNDRSKRLAKKVLTLDIDEGVRIEESSLQRKKIFVNKNASGIFVVQVVVKDRHCDYDKDVRYFDSAEGVVEFVNLTFQGPFSIVQY
jgi:hypothetical protein